MDPQIFYRVQSQDSFTRFTRDGGFDALGHSYMNPCQWINKEKFEVQMDRRDHPMEPTPFISVFDNWDDAVRQAERLRRMGQTNIFIAKIPIMRPTESFMNVEQYDRLVRLPVLQESHTTGTGMTTFISTPAIRMYLGVQSPHSERSEWFAVDNIPREMIEEVVYIN